MCEHLGNYIRHGVERVDFINPGDLKEIPEDVLRSPEIIDAIHSRLIKEFEIYYNQPKIFLIEIERFSRLGFISKEEIVRLPQIKEIAKRCLNSDYPRRPFSQFTPKTLMGAPSPSAEELKKIFLDLGIFEEGGDWEI